MEEPWLSLSLLIGRTFLALVYLVSGIHKGIWYEKALAEFQQATIPFVGAAASICLILGVFVQEVAIALAIFTLLASYKAHNFWNRAGSDRLDQSRIAMAHLAIVGGLLLLAAVGPGRYVIGG